MMTTSRMSVGNLSVERWFWRGLGGISHADLVGLLRGNPGSIGFFVDGTGGWREVSRSGWETSTQSSSMESILDIKASGMMALEVEGLDQIREMCVDDHFLKSASVWKSRRKSIIHLFQLLLNI
jgi:hypothetical protein